METQQRQRSKKKETHIPLNQVKASEVEGASKYKIAFESTILRAVKFPIINHVKLRLLRTQNPNLFFTYCFHVRCS